MNKGQLLAAVLFAGWGSSAGAATPLQWACDTPEGAYSELAQVQAGPAYRVRGAVSWLQSRSHRRWAPSAQVRIENGERSRSIAVRVSGVHGQPQFALEVESSNGGETSRQALATAARDQAVPFEIQVSATGQAVVTIGGQSATAQVDLGPGARVTAVCSTGEFLFTGLDFGG